MCMCTFHVKCACACFMCMPCFMCMCMRTLEGHVQRRAATGGRGVQWSSSGDERVDRLQMAMLSRQVERGDPMRSAGADRGAAYLEQQAHRGRLALPRGHMQRQRPRAIGGRHGAPLGQQRAHRLEHTSPRGQVHRRRPRIVGRVGRAASGEKLENGGRRAEANGMVERRAARATRFGQGSDAAKQG